MKRIYLYKAGLLIFGIGLIVFGIIIIAQGRVILDVAEVFGGVVLLAHGAHLFFNFFFKGKKRNKPSAFIAALLNTAGGVSMFIFPDIPQIALITLFAAYVFLNAAVKFVDYFMLLKDRIPGRFPDLIAGIFYLTFGIITSFVLDMGLSSLLVVAGIYLILYGVSQINDFIIGVIPQKAKRALSRKIRISVPVFISTFMPLWFLRGINRYIGENSSDTQYTAGYKEYKSNLNFKKEEADESPPDLEILIHVTNRGVGKMGHCDLVIDGEVHSYGNYDYDNMSFMRIFGHGIFFTAEKKRYIRFSVTQHKKTIFCFGLRLSPEQMERIRKEIAQLRSKTYVWKPPFQLMREENPNAVMDDSTDECSKLWEGTQARFYKFTEGRYKTYFVLSTNCVLLTDSILGKAGTDIVKINGIVTPGSYFDYLQHQFQLPGSIVISRTIYNRGNTSDFKLSEDVQWEKV